MRFFKGLEESLRDNDAIYDDIHAGRRLLKRLQPHIKRWKKGERKLLEQLLTRRDDRLIKEDQNRKYSEWLSQHTYRKYWTDYSPFGEVDHLDVSFEHCSDQKCACNQPGFETPYISGGY